MTKNKYNYSYIDIENTLCKLGLKKGESVFLSTSLGMLGKPKSSNKNQILTTSKWLLSSIKRIIGKNGNIFVPTYSYSFSKKKVFDPKKTKSEIGYFPNFFLKQKNVIRSFDPMMSIAGTGPDARKVLLKISNNSFGRNCALERLLKIKNLKCCHVGLGYNWIPFLHYLDWKNKAPFRFNKVFYGYSKTKGIKKNIKWVYFARYLRDETLPNGYRIGLKAIRQKLYSFSELGKSMIYIINYKKFYKFAKKITKRNKWLTVNGPKFKI